MAFFYLWTPAEPDHAETFDRFATTLARHAERFAFPASKLGSTRIERRGGTFAGQLTFDHGVTGYRPWCDGADHTVLFSGVCEQVLDGEAPAIAARVWNLASRAPETLATWSGRFSAAAVSRTSRQGFVFTGAVDYVPLWYVEGPEGWAIGNRAAPLLELVGRSARLDPAGAAMMASFGFLLGSHSLFEGVRRIGPRTIAAWQEGRPPRMREYDSLAALLTDPEKPVPADYAAGAAERLTARVTCQLRHSPDPLPLLTGGRDSRCLAAVLHRLGYRGDAFTGGARASWEVRVAARVSRRLGFRHLAPGLSADEVLRHPNCLPRSRAWAAMTEGMECLRHVVSTPDFFFDEKPCLGERTCQCFHGLHGLSRGMYDRTATQDLRGPGELNGVFQTLRKRMVPGLVQRAEAEAYLYDELARFAERLAGHRLSLACWLDLYYWEYRYAGWGADALSGRHLLNWHWTPFVDRELMRLMLHPAPDPDRRKTHFDRLLDAVWGGHGRLMLLDDPLHGWRRPPFPHLARRAAKQGMRWSESLALRGIRSAEKQAAALYWKDVLDVKPSCWPDVLDRGFVDTLRRTDPCSPILWNAATVELTARQLMG